MSERMTDERLELIGIHVETFGQIDAGVATQFTRELFAEVKRLRATPAVVPVGAGLSKGDAKRLAEIRAAVTFEGEVLTDNSIVRDLLAIIEKLTACGEAREGLIVKLGEALRYYGEHDGDCSAMVAGGLADTKCTCRLAAIYEYDAHRASLSGRDAEDGERKEVRGE